MFIILADQIEKFILNFKSKVKITISNEKDLLLDTGGGVKEGTKIFGKNPFFVNKSRYFMVKII